MFYLNGMMKNWKITVWDLKYLQDRFLSSLEESGIEAVFQAIR